MRNLIQSLLLALGFAALLTNPALAQGQRADTGDIWVAIDAGDHAAVERILIDAQARFRSGEDDPDHTRVLFGVFYTNNPQVTDFVQDWLAAFPASPHANVAQAWVNHRISWIWRGEDAARVTHPEALRQFRQLQDKAWEHAMIAYEADKTMRQASDALLRLANGSGQQLAAFRVLDEVMTRDPNMGALMRALAMTIPGWGGSWEMVENMCAHYGPMIDWSEGDPVIYCKLLAARQYSASQEGWIEETILSGDYPSLEHLVLPWFTDHTATREQAEFAFRYLSRDDLWNVRFARAFDENLAVRYDLPFLHETHQRRAKEHARALIERDPYNPDLLKTLASLLMRKEHVAGRLQSTVVERPTKEEELEYARRMIVASPYEPSHWRQYAGLVAGVRNGGDFLEAEPYLINSIVYSNHDPDMVFGYAMEKWQLLNSFESLDTDPQTELWQALSEDQKKKAEAQRQEWLAAREKMDLDKTFRCPMMRAYRLHRILCKSTSAFSCENSARQMEMMEIVRADVTQRRVCTGIMAAREDELFYSPVPADLSAPEG